MLLDLLPHVGDLLLRVPFLAIDMSFMNLGAAAFVAFDAELRRLVGVDHLSSTHSQET